MAVSSSFLAFVIEQLADVSRVSDRRMFGGVGLYSDDVFFGVIDNDTLFFKVNDETRPRYETRGMGPFAPIAGQPPMRGYFQVPPSILEDADALASWAREAVSVGRSAGTRPRRRRSSGRSSNPAARPRRPRATVPRRARGR
jgi:DNA transformation protein